MVRGWAPLLRKPNTGGLPLNLTLVPAAKPPVLSRKQELTQANLRSCPERGACKAVHAVAPKSHRSQHPDTGAFTNHRWQERNRVREAEGGQAGPGDKKSGWREGPTAVVPGPDVGSEP